MIYNYELEVEVWDYLTEWAMIVVTSYESPFDYRTSLSPSELVAMIEDGNIVEFDIFDHRSDPFESGGELYPVLSVIHSMTVSSGYLHEPSFFVEGRIYLIDNVGYLPKNQMGDAYDNLTSIGFMPKNVRAMTGKDGQEFYNVIRGASNSGNNGS